MNEICPLCESVSIIRNIESAFKPDFKCLACKRYFDNPKCKPLTREQVLEIENLELKTKNQHLQNIVEYLKNCRSSNKDRFKEGMPVDIIGKENRIVNGESVINKIIGELIYLDDGQIFSIVDCRLVSYRCPKFPYIMPKSERAGAYQLWLQGLRSLLDNIYEPFRKRKTQCWVFNEKSYPDVQYNGETIKLHRAACIYSTGRSLYEWEVARHLCNNNRCIRPEHLKGGTQQENGADLKKSTIERKAKILSAIELIEIKDIIRCGRWTDKAIATEYCVLRKVITSIKLGCCAEYLTKTENET